MIVVLKWNYVSTGNDILDALYKNDFKSQDELAVRIGISRRTLDRNIAKLKKDKKLIIHRYEKNNFIYLIGSDVNEGWSSYEAYEIAKFRIYERLVLTVEEDELREFLSDLPVFDSEKEELAEDNGFSPFVPEKITSKKMEFTMEERLEIDRLCDENWFYIHKDEEII